MAEVPYNNSLGQLGAPCASSDTSVTFTGSPGWATLSGGDYIKLVLDPPVSTVAEPNPLFEIIYVTAYTSGASTALISRGEEGTTPQNHAVNAIWGCFPTVADFAGEGVTSVTAADTSIVIAGTAGAPTVATGTLDVIAADHPPVADWSNNAHKITGLAAGTASTDAVNVGQLPSLEVTDGTHTVTGATEIDFTSGATVTVSGTTAQVAVTGSGGSGGATVQGAIGTSLGATQTVNFASTAQEIWLTGILSADLTVTVSNVVAGCTLRALMLTGAGGWTLTVTDGSSSLGVPISLDGATAVQASVRFVDTTTMFAE